MLKRSFRMMLVMLLAATVGYAANEDRGLPPLEYDVAPPPSATNLWFHVGEVGHYGIYWGIFGVGNTEASTRWVKDEEGRTLLLIRFETHSNSVIEKIYPITDIQESLIDPETFLTLYYHKKSKQGSRVEHELVTFDHEAGKAYWESFTKGRTEVVDIEPDSRDIITTMYYLRAEKEGIGRERTFRVYTDEKMYDLFVITMKEEEIDVDKYGDVMCTKYEPIAQFEGLFVSKGRMFMWVSNDDRRICTMLQAKIPVASVRLKLLDLDGPGNDFWVADDETLKSRQKNPKKRDIHRGR